MIKDETDTNNQPTSLRTAKELLDTISQQLQSFDVTTLSQSKVIKGDSSTTNQLALLQTAKERLDTILLGIDAAKQVGCMDEGIKQALQYQVRKILLEDIIKPYLPSKWSVLDRAMYLGYNPNRTQLIAIGKEAARLYREQHGENPPQLEEIVNGDRLVNIYSGKAIILLDTAISKVMTA